MEQEFRAIVEELFSNWVETISLREIESNEPLLRAIERFECLLYQPNL